MTRRTLVPLAIAATLVLTGCSASTTDLAADTAAELRATARSVAELTAAGDSEAALTSLTRLEEDLRSAEADGDVSAEKSSAVQEIIDLIRAELQPAEPVLHPIPYEPDATTATTTGDATTRTADADS